MLDELKAPINARLTLFACHQNVRLAQQRLVSLAIRIPHSVNIDAARKLGPIVLQKGSVLSCEESTVELVRVFIPGEFDDVHPYFFDRGCVMLLAAAVLTRLLVRTNVVVYWVVSTGQDGSMGGVVLGFGGGVCAREGQGIEQLA